MDRVISHVPRRNPLIGINALLRRMERVWIDSIKEHSLEVFFLNDYDKPICIKINLGGGENGSNKMQRMW